ncbi:hypothetical protein STEG23_029766, partial [Scotinomys teguina]
KHRARRACFEYLILEDMYHFLGQSCPLENYSQRSKDTSGPGNAAYLIEREKTV